MKKNHYKTIGVDKRADKRTIKRAYRKRAAELHPDKGGSHDDFVQLQRAYAVLNDDTRRAHYDETGDDLNSPRESEAVSLFLKTFLEVIDGSAGEVNALRITRERLVGAMNEMFNRQTELTRRISNSRKQLTRYKPKTDGTNFIAEMMNERMAQMSKGIAELQSMIKLHGAALEVAESYEFVGEEQQSPSFYTTINANPQAVFDYVKQM